MRGALGQIQADWAYLTPEQETTLRSEGRIDTGRVVFEMVTAMLDGVVQDAALGTARNGQQMLVRFGASA
jgi:hypothetical protein